MARLTYSVAMCKNKKPGEPTPATADTKGACTLPGGGYGVVVGYLVVDTGTGCRVVVPVLGTRVVCLS